MARLLSGMRIAITGASSGIGAALARQLAGAGARLALCARRQERLQQLARELTTEPYLCTTDVADPAACAAFVAGAAQALGGIDTLVCNAGYGLVATIEATSIAQWEAILRTNLLGTTACLAAAAPLMRAQPLRQGWRGQVMIVASGLSRRGRPDAGAYSATKAAQLSVAEAARVELQVDAIAVTSVHPVGTSTEFNAVAGSGGRPWTRTRGEPLQSAEHVAARMVRAIVRPRPEVWPHRLSRYALAAAKPCCPAWPTGCWPQRPQR